MSKVDKIYEWLSGDESPEASAILAAALAHAEPPYIARIAGILLGRRHDVAWAALVADHDRLPVEVQRALDRQPELLRAGIGSALRSRVPRGRQSALAFLIGRPDALLAYDVAEALRDPDPHIRAQASAVLRITADRVLDPPQGIGDPFDAAGSPAERAALLVGLRETLRTFSMHQRVDALETCLWFAKELGAVLWDSLTGPRSRTGPVVALHLASWNHPRLAGFLLLALAQLAWRKPARALLNTWSTRADLLALLEHTDLLANPLIRRRLRLLRRPVWLGAAGPLLADLPRDMRAKVPQWVCHLGFSPVERVRWLRRWQQSPLPEVQRAATDALATLRTAERPA